MAKIRLWMGFGANHLTPLYDVNWLQIPDEWVLSPMSWNGGRSFELDQTPGATATVMLDNSKRQFDPSYRDGPYYDDFNDKTLLTNGLPIMATVDHGSFSGEHLFTMYVPEWPQVWQGPTHNHLSVTCVDRLAMWERVPGHLGAWDHVCRTTNPIVYYQMLDGNRADTAQDAMGQWHGKYYGGCSQTAGLSPGSAAGSVAFSAGAYLDVASSPLFASPWNMPSGYSALVAFWFAADFDPDGEFHHMFLQRYQGRTVSIHITPTGRVGASWTNDGAGLARESIVPVLDGQPHCVVWRAGPNGFDMSVDGNTVVADAQAAFAPPSIGVQLAGALGNEDRERITMGGFAAWYGTNAAMTGVMNSLLAARTGYAGERSSDMMVRTIKEVNPNLNVWEDFDLDTGISTLPAWQGGGSATQQLHSFNGVESGFLYVDRWGWIRLQNRHYRYKKSRALNVQAKLGDDADCIPLADQFISGRPLSQVRNVVTGSTAQGAERTARNEQAITDLGAEYSYSVGQLPIAPGELESRCQWTAQRFGWPMDRIDGATVRMHLNPEVGPDSLTQVLGLQLSDLIEVRHTPQEVGDPLVYRMHLEGFEHVVNLADGDVVDWAWTPRLSPADVTQWWVLGTHRLNQTARLAY